MQATEQTKGQSVLEHGQSVWEYYQDLRDHVLHGKPLKFEWRLPDWVFTKGLWDKVYSDNQVEEYLVYHDNGKVLCREVDDEGRVHFPNHAKVSADNWLRLTGNHEVAELMRLDMDIHLMKAEGLVEFASRKGAATLLLAGLCEVHSNARMFGGIESSSFKAKWKQIDRRGKQLVKMLTE